MTCISLPSKYQAAIPLKRVDAVSGAGAMVDFFSRIGIPYEMLTYQCSIFMGKLNNELYGLLNIDHHRISLYHSQMDGCQERWHGFLKHMLRKCKDRMAQWDIHMKYFLFAYRCSPNSNSGFPPFEIIFGKPGRGPLDVLREGWLEGEFRKYILLNG